MTQFHKQGFSLLFFLLAVLQWSNLITGLLKITSLLSKTTQFAIILYLHGFIGRPILAKGTRMSEPRVHEWFALTNYSQVSMWIHKFSKILRNISIDYIYDTWTFYCDNTSAIWLKCSGQYIIDIYILDLIERSVVWFFFG